MIELSEAITILCVFIFLQGMCRAYILLHPTRESVDKHLATSCVVTNGKFEVREPLLSGNR